MKAAIYVGDGKFEMQDVPAPTPERPGDVVIKVLAASICGTDSIVYQFVLAFVLVFAWNCFWRWPAEWWSTYFFVTLLAVPVVLAAITTVWFGIGGVIDLRKLFRDLRVRVVNPLDDGRVENSMSLVDKAELEAVDKRKSSDD